MHIKTLGEVKDRLSLTMLPAELDIALPFIEEIRKVKRDKNAVILGHNYMTPDVYWGVSDIVGDSLGLSREAARVEADMILFNGVHFMAETAKILSPDKKVLIADTEAGCSLAESITGEDVRELKRQYPGVPVVTYVNCTAEVKAETDICCTSANASRVVNSLDTDTVLFLPDKYLAGNVQTDKRIITWDKGACEVHEQYTGEDIEFARKQYSDLLVISHPECDKPVINASDFSGSTSQMEDAIRRDGRKNILLVTECGMADNLRSVFPERNFISTCHTCPHMKKITLPKILETLKNESPEVIVPEHIAVPARRAVENMLALG